MSVALSSRRSLGNTSLIVGGGGGEDKPKPKTKRYSTAFGTTSSSPQSKDERKKQQDVAELYQGVVKRVQENKMTSKNAFMSRMFIDDLDVVLVQAKGSFHKASCAVSTAAEVYCLLVDDLSQSTTLVQELLFNNSSSGANAMRGETDGEEQRANRKRVLGGADGNGGGVSSTLETNLANIRSESVEAELEIDAQFQKLLQGKDTGSQGMLLNLLKVHDGANLALDSACIPAFAGLEEDPRPKPLGELLSKELVSKLGKSNPNPLFTVGKAFAELGEETDRLGQSQGLDSIVATLDPRSSFASQTSSSLACVSGGEDEAPMVEDYDYDMGGFGDDDGDDGGGGYEEEERVEQPTAVPFIMRAFDAQAMETENGRLETFVIPSNALLEFHSEQQQKLPSGKVWLGFTHWKAPKPSSSISDGKVDGAPPAIKRPKKQVKKIDFCKLGEVNTKLAFAKPTSAKLIQLPKSSSKSASSTRQLPLNTHFTTTNLCQFFLRPNQVLKGNNALLSSTGVGREGDFLQDDGYDDYIGGGGEDDGDYGGDDGEDEHDYLDQSEMRLVAPAHHVERIRVAYATRAKKVDVKQLKVDLWDTIDTLNPDVEKPQEEEEKMEEEPAKVSLTGSIRMTQVQNPQPAEAEVITVPFYFICMLHLANEKGLELHSSQDLDDIAIFRSTC
ncbi:hypothetical protein BASA81_001221 [Batrachochytrium salamandrivorans]|nr:hypothetical protein BASA81_001221 [Batrachochytrium salamandrivorans]